MLRSFATVVSCLLTLLTVASEDPVSQSGNLRGSQQVAAQVDGQVEEGVGSELDTRDFTQCGILGGPIRRDGNQSLCSNHFPPD